MPTLIDLPVKGMSHSSSASARTWSSAFALSTNVMARARATRSPTRMAFAVSSTSFFALSVLRMGGGVGGNPVQRKRSNLLRGLWRFGIRAELLHEIDGRVGDGRARAEDGLGARRMKLGIVLRRDHAADDNHNVAAALRLERLAQSRPEGQVTRGKRRDADDMHVALDRLARGVLGRLEQRPDIDIEA